MPARSRRCTPSALVPAVLTGEKYLPDDIAVIPPWASVLTSMFMHGGFWHLAGNMLYLWIFGNNLEDAMGHVRYFLFYVLCGVAAVFASVLPNPVSEMPMVGASGAISGVLGGYLLLFPRARVLLGLPLGFIIVGFGRFPAIWVLAAWFVMQLVLGGLVRDSVHRRIPGWHRLRRAHRRVHRGTRARRIFQTTQRSAVAALLRRCYIPRTLRAPKLSGSVLGS